MLALVFVVGILLGVFLSGLYREIFPPSVSVGAYFVENCVDLNGKALTYENINKLRGQLFATWKTDTSSYAVGLIDLKKEHIDQYLKIINNGESNMPFPHPHVPDGGYYDDTLALSRGKLEGDWRCNIKLDKETNKIKADIYFAPES